MTNEATGGGGISLRGRWGRVGLAVLPWAFLALVLVTRGGGPFSASRFREWTGLPCPLCGGTRALMALLAGEWQRALFLNPLALVAVAGAVAVSAWMLAEAWTGRRGWRGWNLGTAQAPQVLRGLLVGLGLFWVYHVVAAVGVPKRELLDAGGWVWRVFPMPGESAGTTGADHE